MKKLLLALCSVAAISATAQTTVKKVFIEDYTGTWCGWCPEGTVVLEGLEVQYPSTVIPVANHNGDALQTADGAAIDAGLNVTAYPNGSIDRFQFAGEAKVPVSRSKWATYVSQRLATSAKVSVSFSNMVKNGTTYTGKINVKFLSAPTAGVPLAVNVYVLEDSIAATGSYAQGNYSSAVQGGATPLVNWFHNNTLRQALGTAWGWTTVIPATPVVGTTYSQNISVTVPTTWKAKQIHLVGFVAYNGDVASNQKEILNSEEVHFKNVYGLGINDQTAAVSVNDIYPNPATASDVVKVEYNLLKTSQVDLRVMNMMGQVVARPYSSFEVQGTHTAPFRPSEHGLTSGTYIVEVSTADGKKVMPFTVR